MMTATLRPASNQEFANQRRPTRIGAGYQVPDSQQQNHGGIVSHAATTSRLKSSTISKVPPASRSFIKPPVAPTESSSQQESRVRQPSRLAKPTATRERPTSLALKPPSQTTSSSNKQICSSILPRFSSSTILSKPKSTYTIKTSSKTSPTQTTHVQTSTIKRRPKQGNDSSNLATSNSSSSSLAAGENRCLSGRLKNLVAVVHPQHSQRVNSSATGNKPAATCNKNTGKTNATTCSSSSLNANNSTTTVATSSATSRSVKQENGKVSFNHRDVDADKSKKKEAHQAGRCESKQSGVKRIIALASGVPATSKAKINEQTIVNVEDDDDNDGPERQFLQSANDGFTTESVNLMCTETSDNVDTETPSRHSGSSYDDHEQQLSQSFPDKNKQAAIVPAPHSPRQQRVASTETTLQQTGRPLTEVRDGPGEDNSFYSNDVTKPALIKSPAIYFNREPNNGAISDRLLPKPMGQQVLSLLMLDVGLVPPANGTSSQQICSATNRKDPHIHHRLHAISCGHDATDSEPHIIDNCVESFNHDRHFFNRADYQDHEQQCNNYHSMQPTCDVLGPQVHFSSGEGVNQRSISLPCSPQAKRLRGASKRPNVNQHFDQQPQEKLVDRLDQLRKLGGFSRKTLLSVDLLRQHSNRNQSYSFCDNLDSQSIASSSCSSLNQCPPALALTNQLHEFGDLIKDLNSTAQTADDEISNLIVLEGSTQKSNNQSCTRVVKTKLMDDCGHDLNPAIKNQHSGKIDRARTYSEDSGHTFEKNHHIGEKVQENNQDSGLERLNGLDKEESNQDASFERQQQTRSHSISGQDYHLNGEYQRIKQSYYAQQNSYNSQQFYESSSTNHLQRVASPYQQLQPQPGQNVLGRSPSPMSLGTQSHYGSLQRDGINKYSSDSQSIRSHLDYSGNDYSDYQQQQNIHHMIQQQSQHSVHNYQQQQHPNKHYASGYVLAPPPANTIVNHNGDQDMAAAAMGPDSRQYNSVRTPTNSPSLSANPYHVQNQSIIERAMAQVSSSPLRRLGLNTASTNGASSGMLHNLANMHHPMRAGHSSISLASSSFIIEDKLQNEIKKLHSELKSEKEKNEALNSQLNINSSLMSAFEQSLTTLNTRLRQLTTLNEKKDQEIEELREQLRPSAFQDMDDKGTIPCYELATMSLNGDNSTINSEHDSNSEKDLKKTIEDLRRQLIEKDRLLTDTRLEALSAAHQLEQLESKLNGEHSLLINEDDLDEGVMVVNHSPSDSEAITDSAQFSDMNNHLSNHHKSNNQHSTVEQTSFTLDSSSANNDRNNNHESSIESNHNADDRSTHSSDYSSSPKEQEGPTLNQGIARQFNCEDDSGAMNKLIDSLLS